MISNVWCQIVFNLTFVFNCPTYGPDKLFGALNLEKNEEYLETSSVSDPYSFDTDTDPIQLFRLKPIRIQSGSRVLMTKN
jgi:hypothetical protein